MTPILVIVLCLMTVVKIKTISLQELTDLRGISLEKCPKNCVIIHLKRANLNTIMMMMKIRYKLKPEVKIMVHF